MTYIEFFDKTASENVCACLTHAPDRVIFIGDSAKLIKRHVDNYEKVFIKRGCNIEFIVRTVPRSNLDAAVALLSEIVESYDDCVFDITGGDEIFTLALGVVYDRYPHKNIQIHKFNIKNNVIYDCDKDGVTIYKDAPTLSVGENIRIYGGDIVYGDIDEGKTYRWELDDDFLKDISVMWECCRENVRGWNGQIGCFAAAFKVGRVKDDGLTVVAKKEDIDEYLSQYKTKYKAIKSIIYPLTRHRLIRYFEEDEKSVSITFKNKQIKKCLTLAGLALELKVYTLAKSLSEGGRPVYNDALHGVVLDWDGAFHDEGEEGFYDTENEIDVMLMHDVVPVFISCKNGVVTSEELYKLNTVAERFGGQYSKKILIATSIPTIGESGQYFRQRAKDMNIRLIEDVQDMSDEEFGKKLKTLWNC